MIRFFTFLIFLLLLVTSGVLFMTKDKISSSGGEIAPVEENKSSGQAAIGGEFTLTNQDGVVVTDKDYRGKVMLVFFGFTSCPDICPVSVATYGRLLSMLGESAKDVAPIFITIDPEVDTPAVMKDYLSKIDGRIIGLSGNEEQTKNVVSAYKAFFSKTKSENGEDEVDHSGYIYLMDKNGLYIKHFPYNATAEEILPAVKDLLK